MFLPYAMRVYRINALSLITSLGVASPEYGVRYLAVTGTYKSN